MQALERAGKIAERDAAAQAMIGPSPDHDGPDEGPLILAA
jgi:hypothetical protein